MKKLLILAVASAALAGCTNYGKLSQNLKDDPAIVILNVGTPWGTQKLVRIGGQSNSVAITPEGSVTITPVPVVVGKKK